MAEAPFDRLELVPIETRRLEAIGVSCGVRELAPARS
jgi:hypothetical protein